MGQTDVVEYSIPLMDGIRLIKQPPPPDILELRKTRRLTAKWQTWYGEIR